MGRNVSWPAPNVDSGLARLVRGEPPVSRAGREAVFACVDAAFAQRRKTLRAALKAIAPVESVEAALRHAQVDPSVRGEQLDIHTFARLAEGLPR